VQTKPKCLVGTIDFDRSNAGETAIISKDPGRCTELLQRLQVDLDKFEVINCVQLFSSR
jgi:hypothetical protein